MVERVAVNHQVGGSSPSSGAKMLLGHQQVREHFYFMGNNESLSHSMRGFLIYQSLEGREVYPDSEAYWEVIFPVTLENKASSNSSFEL